MATDLFRTACPLDCPDACSLSVEVADGRLGRVDGWRSDGGGGNPLTRGLICGKVRRVGRHLECAERLATPLVRVGPKGSGEFRPVDWDEALGQVVERLGEIVERHGPESVLPVYYGGSNGLLTQGAADATFFRRLGAARLEATLCAAPSGAALEALYGKLPGIGLDELESSSELIVVWGANPHASGIHLVPRIEAARARGARLVVVDPRRTPLARRADLHLAPRPGTDLPLALAVANLLFERGQADLEFLARHASGVEEFRRVAGAWSAERAAAECGVEAREIEHLAELYGATRRAVIRLGYGPERNRNGGFACAAILALPAVAGHFGAPGAGYIASAGGAWRGLLGDACEDPDRASRVVNLNRLGRELLEPDGDPIRAVFVYNANPVATLPDQERVRRGLAREDLLSVVFDAVRTDTAELADVILPATTFLEHSDIVRSYGVPGLLDVRPVLDARGSARSNHAVFTELAERMGLLGEGELPGESELRHRILAPFVAAGHDPTPLELDGYLPAPIEGAPVVDRTPPTPDGRIQLMPAAFSAHPQGPYGYRPEAGVSGPLALISAALPNTISSTFAQLIPGQVPLGMHPRDAEARGLVEGDRVRVFNELGQVITTLELDPDLRPGVVSLPKGLWARHTQNGRTANALVPDHLSDLGRGACFNDARVEVERA